jgi:hypothetical protein
MERLTKKDTQETWLGLGEPGGLPQGVGYARDIAPHPKERVMGDITEWLECRGIISGRLGHRVLDVQLQYAIWVDTTIRCVRPRPGLPNDTSKTHRR